MSSHRSDIADMFYAKAPVFRIFIFTMRLSLIVIAVKEMTARKEQSDNLGLSFWCYPVWTSVQTCREFNNEDGVGAIKRSHKTRLRNMHPSFTEGS